MTVREAIRSALRLHNSRDRRLLSLAIAIQAATSILDLAGVLLIGLVGALAVTTIQSQPPPAAATEVARAFGLDDLSDQTLVALYAGLAAIVLLAKSGLNAYLTRRTFRFLANRQALVSARLARALLSRPLVFIQRRSSQETSFALIGGANAATVQLLGQFVLATSELALLVVLGVALLFVSPLVALGAIIFFAIIGVALQRAMGGWASTVGIELARADIASLSAVQEALSAYREISVSARRSLYVERIQDLRWQAAKISADAQFMGMFPKYMFEVALVVGGFLLAGALFATQDSVVAAGTLALFLAAGTRIMPSLLRLQSATLGMRSSAGMARPTLELSSDLDHPTETTQESSVALSIRERIRHGNPSFVPNIKLSKVTVTYEGATVPALRGVDLSISSGQSIALVGRSGAGKSTLADVILGVIIPDHGTVSISGAPPTDAISQWPGALSYVPQSIALSEGSIRSNVALGLPDEAIDDDLVWEALGKAHLADFLTQHREGLATLVGEGGLRLSGGQRQRLGIARALYTRPRLIVLDEATSALDAETEESVTKTISDIGEDVTRIIIAHRLSTVRHVDAVVYLEDGRLTAQGTFDEVARQVPGFGQRARLGM